MQLCKRRCSSIAALLVLVAATAGAAVVWHSLGTVSVKATPVDAKPQAAEIRLMSARGPFTTVRLEVYDGSVTLDRLVVTFAHGSTQSADLQNKTFEPGSLTPELQLTGNDHVIRKVTFWYNAPKFANVRLYAR
jgi:hypothetical protein